MAPHIYPIEPANLTESTAWNNPEFAIARLRFRVFLQHNHTSPHDETLSITANLVYGGKDARGRTGAKPWARDRPILLYLCGGPGADNPPLRVPEMNRWLLENGYSILYVNYRGCRDSSPVSLALEHMTASRDLDDSARADYITHFCQDNIVRDLEAIRLCLSQLQTVEGTVYPTGLRWTILGQSYGGYMSLSYLSMHPEGLQDVFITGGLPPCGMNIDDYFRIEYRDIVAQNQAFYSTYPDADALVRSILGLITKIGYIPMTGRGHMTGQKLLTLGRQFGSKVGFPEVYNLLKKIERDLSTEGRLQTETTHEFESILHIDERPLYPLLLEQTWCSGNPTRWAAERVAREIPGFEYLRTDKKGDYPDPSLTPAGQPIYFTANTYCRFHYDTHEELVDFKGAAERLAEHDWECPYDFDRLLANPLGVPIYAVSFQRDMHLDVGVAARTAAMVGGLRLVIDPGWHQDIRYKPAQVLENLFREREIAKEERRTAGATRSVT